MARNTRTYSDFDLNFLAHPAKKDLVRKYDDNAIKQSLKNLLLTRNFERPFHSEIGSPIRRLMFEPAGPMTSVVMKRAIIDVVNNFEPRVKIIDVNVRDNIDNNVIFVRIEYQIINTSDNMFLDLTLERTR